MIVVLFVALLTLALAFAAAGFGVAVVATRRARTHQAALEQFRTRMQRREAVLVQAQRMEALAHLSGVVAHDFNNLLTIVLGNFEMIALAPERLERTARLAKAGMTAAQRGAELTALLLAFSRRSMAPPDIIDLNRTLRELEPVLRKGVPETVALSFDLGPDPLHAALDPEQFRVALGHLLANACDAMANRGTLRLSTGRLMLEGADDEATGLEPGEYVRVAVVDDGPGMDAATAKRAFEPFFTTRQAGQRTGLGLSQVYGLCRHSGGVARILSVVGQGATVELLLPKATRSIP